MFINEGHAWRLHTTESLTTYTRAHTHHTHSHTHTHTHTHTYIHTYIHTYRCPRIDIGAHGHRLRLGSGRHGEGPR
jgi:hypothetical protein